MLLLPLFVFLATFLLAAVAVWVASAVMERQQPAAEGGEENGPSLFKEEELSSISIWDNLLARFDFVAGMKKRIAQADLSWTVGRLTSMMLLIGIVALVSLRGFSWLPFWLAFLLSGLAAMLPYFYVLRRRGRRFAQFEEQFPEALDFLARAMRVGHPIAVSIELLAAENQPPLATEMRIAADERRLGMPLEQALANLARRVPLLNVRLFVAAVVLQSRTGGKLSEVLGQLAETMRESGSLQGEVRALAAHGKMTGSVLTALPIGIAAMMMSVNPGYLGTLTEHEWGKYMIAAAIAALVAAHFIIRKIVDIKL
ncbi:MAG: type II secretion system F family protein [Candidatus Solibacter usitatus]|nr:type II secretion system F family protein [Candidatus Solibacter usitatus]